jgi:hypothetical protein
MRKKIAGATEIHTPPDDFHPRFSCLFLTPAF